MNRFFVIVDCHTGNEYTTDSLPLLRDYGNDLAIDAIWLDESGNVEYGQIDVFTSGWSGNAALAQMLGIDTRSLDEPDYDDPRFDDIEFVGFEGIYNEH